MRRGLAGDVNLPATGEVTRQLLRFLHLRNQPVRPQIMYQELADHFGLNALQLNAKRRTTNESAWHNRVQTARRRLVDLGLMDASRHGLWILTEAGKKEALSPVALTLEDLGL